MKMHPQEKCRRAADCRPYEVSMIQIATIGKIASVDLSSYGQTMSGISAGRHPPLYRDPCVHDAGPILSGTSGRRCFRLSQKSFLIFLIVAPENDGRDERHNERRPSKWSSDSTDAFSKHVSAQPEHCRPDDSPGGVEDEKPQRG